MSIHSLPTELLHEILSFAAGNPSASLNHGDHCFFVETLSTCSLIRSSWRPVAQELLWDQLWLQGSRTEFKRKAKLLAELAQYPTRYLTIHGDVDQALNLTGIERWASLKLLRAHEKRRSADTTPLKLELFAQFPNLEILDMSLAGSYLVCDPNSTVSFPLLRRFVLEDDSWTSPPLWTCKQVFTPVHMPNLTHLSLGTLARNPPDIMQVFVGLFPQLRTLALDNTQSAFDYVTAFKTFIHFTKLKHLSLFLVPRQITSALFDCGANFDLESLHLNASQLMREPEMIERLVRVAEGDSRETIRAKRIVLFGASVQLGLFLILTRPGIDLNLFEWRTGNQLPPFANFDGK